MTGWIVLAVLVAVVVALTLAGRRAEAPRNEPDEDRAEGDSAEGDSAEGDSAEDDAADGDDVAVIAIEDAIDLHGFQPKEIPDVVESYLEAAVEKGLREVRLIHGRGKGVQRQRVREVLGRHPDVLDFGDAPAHRGGWGATIARLRKSDEPSS